MRNQHLITKGTRYLYHNPPTQTCPPAAPWWRRQPVAIGPSRMQAAPQSGKQAAPQSGQQAAPQSGKQAI
eukprot:364730-Chlamydomonas_euryale.AAC.11